MNETKRNKYSGEFKAKVALEVIRGIKTVKLCSGTWVHPTQIGLWKKELQEHTSSLFDAKRGPTPADLSASPERLFSEIGRLKMELDWLKKVWDQPVEKRRQWVRSVEQLALTRQCELAGVNRSVVYAPQMAAKQDAQELTLLRHCRDMERPRYSTPIRAANSPAKL